MLNKEKVLEVLEKERQFAIQINEPKMALGIAQAIQTIRGMEENNLGYKPHKLGEHHFE